MPGTWIARLGERLLHGDTFTLMLSPAIADLQFEAPSGGVARPSHYAAVLHAFAGALWCDLSADLLSLTGDLPTIGVLTAIQASYYGFMLVLLSGLGTGRLLELDFNTIAARGMCYALAIGVASVLTSSACFWPPRRSVHAVGAH
jgi:hypothetical protein